MVDQEKLIGALVLGCRAVMLISMLGTVTGGECIVGLVQGQRRQRGAADEAGREM